MYIYTYTYIGTGSLLYVTLVFGTLRLALNYNTLVKEGPLWNIGPPSTFGSISY